jgi:hypothetical protein
MSQRNRRNTRLGNARKTAKSNPTTRNPFTDQTVAFQNTASNVPRREVIKGRARALDLTAVSNKAVSILYLDYEGFDRAGLESITSIMGNYERWRIVRMHAKYVPVVSKTAPGSVSLAPDFDPLDLPITDPTDLAVSDRYKSGPVSNLLSIDVTPPTFRNDDLRYVSPAGDTRLSSVGFVIASIDGLDATDGTRIGYLEIDYEIELVIKTPLSLAMTPGVGATVLTTNAAYNDVRVSADLVPYYSAMMTMVPAMAGSFDGIYSAIYKKALSTISFATASGRELADGTRVWFKTPRLMQVSGGTWTDACQGVMGTMALDHNFQQLLYATGASLATGYLSTVRHMKLYS